jgi:hypothetical protein
MLMETVPRTLRRLLIPWIAVGSPACNGAASPFCDVSSETVSASSDSALGFSFEGALGDKQELEAVVDWREPPSWLNYETPQQSGVVFALDDLSNRVQFVERQNFNGPSDEPTYCASALSGSGQLSVKTRDGSLDEILEVEIQIYDPTLIVIDSEAINTEDLKGSLDLGMRAQLDLRLTIADGTISGRLRTWASESTSTSSNLRVAAIASWEGSL